MPFFILFGSLPFPGFFFARYARVALQMPFAKVSIMPAQSVLSSIHFSTYFFRSIRSRGIVIQFFFLCVFTVQFHARSHDAWIFFSLTALAWNCICRLLKCLFYHLSICRRFCFFCCCVSVHFHVTMPGFFPFAALESYFLLRLPYDNDIMSTIHFSMS